MTQLIWWWWVWSLGIYWDDVGWSVYFGPFELRIERDNFRLGTKTPPPSEESLYDDPDAPQEGDDEDNWGRPPADTDDEWDFRKD